MRKIWHRRIQALLLTGLLACPAAALAESFACFHKPQHCAPAPASLITQCCNSPADTNPSSITVNVLVAYGPAAAPGAVSGLLTTVLEIVPWLGLAAVCSPPRDRLALFGHLLI
jgi:hypothetical protein